MSRKLDDVLAALPAKQRPKIDGRAMEWSAHKNLRPVADHTPARALNQELAALAIQGWNNLQQEGGSYADGHSTL